MPNMEIWECTMVLQCSKTLHRFREYWLEEIHCTCTVHVYACVIETTTYTVTCPSLSVRTCTSYMYISISSQHFQRSATYDTLHVTFHRSCMSANSLIFPFLHHIMIYIPLVLIIPISPCWECRYHCDLCHHQILQIGTLCLFLW